VPVLRVGAKRELKPPSAAAEIARDGDIIEIDAGIYDGDPRSGGRSAHDPRVADCPPARDGAQQKTRDLVIKGNEPSRNVEFSGATVSDQNWPASGSRGRPDVRDCYFTTTRTAS